MESRQRKCQMNRCLGGKEEKRRKRWAHSERAASIREGRNDDGHLPSETSAQPRRITQTSAKVQVRRFDSNTPANSFQCQRIAGPSKPSESPASVSPANSCLSFSRCLAKHVAKFSLCRTHGTPPRRLQHKIDYDSANVCLVKLNLQRRSNF